MATSLTVRRRARLLASLLAACGTLPVWASQTPAPTFRGAADVIAVDVQVIGRDGQPVTGLTRDHFEVTINGQRRRVISATFVDAYRTTAAPATPVAAAPAEAPDEATVLLPPTPPARRIVILAIDATSLDVAAAREAAVAAQRFVGELPASDLVGLFTFPLGPRVDPTIDRAELARGLDGVVGQKLPTRGFKFDFRPSDLVDLSPCHSYSSGPPNNRCDEVAKWFCGNDDLCLRELAGAVQLQTMEIEGQAHASLGQLGSLFDGLAEVPGRKTVILVSGGVLSSDLGSGRPNLDDLSTQVGKAAARSNVAVYSLFLDRSLTSPFQAQTVTGGRQQPDNEQRSMVRMENFARDSAVTGRWLDRFSGLAGGTLVKAVGGDGTLEFSRIRDEMSAYYLLGVEPGEADRDGRLHPMEVKVAGRGMIVRGRSWVMVPKPGEPLHAIPAATPWPDSLRTIADAFARADYAAFTEGVARADLANLIRDYRQLAAPWPDSPRRASVLALELAVAGLFSANGYAREEGTKLLAQAHAGVRQPGEAGNDFECTWYWAEAAALQGLQQPEFAAFFVERSRQRCPDHARLGLARAVILEEQWRRDADPRLLEASLAQYGEAQRTEETAVEASVRAAWLSYHAGTLDRAVAFLSDTPAPDRRIRYFQGLVTGHVQRARGRVQAAEAAYRSALEAWPGGQAGRVALMSLLLRHDGREEAGALAESIQTAGEDDVDPWWTYARGDFAGYPVILAMLRELVQ
jgi:VWFA-related protein